MRKDFYLLYQTLHCSRLRQHRLLVFVITNRLVRAERQQRGTQTLQAVLDTLAYLIISFSKTLEPKGELWHIDLVVRGLCVLSCRTDDT